MIKVLKLTVLSAFLLFATVNSTNAAFPKDKEMSSKTVVSNAPISNELNETPATKAELKKELNSLKKETNQFRGSGGKSKILAAVLAFFLGGFGVHNFYMGYKKKGFMQLGITVVGIIIYAVGIASYVSGSGTSFPVLALLGYLLLLGVGIWAFIDFIRILTGGLAPEEGFDS